MRTVQKPERPAAGRGGAQGRVREDVSPPRSGKVSHPREALRSCLPSEEPTRQYPCQPSWAGNALAVSSGAPRHDPLQEVRLLETGGMGGATEALGRRNVALSATHSALDVWFAWENPSQATL